MVNVGDVIENPVTGERITFVRTSTQTGGEVAELDLELPPGSFLPAAHLHQRQDKRFEVLEGRLRLKRGDEESVLEPGEVVEVPAGTPHSWVPEGDEPARVRLTFTPGAGIEDFFDEFFRLAREGHTGSDGMPSMLRAAHLARRHHIYRPGPPIAVQRAMFGVLAGVGRLVHRG